jgi:hypothetical protein
MDSPRSIAILFLTMYTAFCGSSHPASPEGPAPDFALRFDHKGCHYEYLDTFNGTVGQMKMSPVPFTLSAEERRTLFAAVIASNFFERPADLGTGNDPTTNYALEVRNAGRRHTVRWTAGSKWGQSEDSRPLWKLHESIFKVLENHLGPRGGGCAEEPPPVR